MQKHKIEIVIEIDAPILPLRREDAYLERVARKMVAIAKSECNAFLEKESHTDETVIHLKTK